MRRKLEARREMVENEREDDDNQVSINILNSLICFYSDNFCLLGFSLPYPYKHAFSGILQIAITPRVVQIAPEVSEISNLSIMVLMNWK